MALTSAYAQRRLNLILARIEPLKGVCRLKPRSPKPWFAQVSLVSSAQIKKLNSKFRGKRKATDVLSFSAPAPFSSQGFLGELIICLPVLRAQAKELKHKSETELEILIVHGLLHLLGWDHEKSGKEAKAMALIEKKILKRVGLIERAHS